MSIRMTRLRRLYLFLVCLVLAAACVVSVLILRGGMPAREGFVALIIIFFLLMFWPAAWTRQR